MSKILIYLIEVIILIYCILLVDIYIYIYIYIKNIFILKIHLFTDVIIRHFSTRDTKGYSITQ